MARLAAVLALALASCAWRPGTYTGPREVTGSCTGACRHYVRCKDEPQGAVYDACVAECRAIFVEDGRPDTVTLSMFERLQCTDAIAFIEGPGGRAPGSSPPDLTPAERASRPGGTPP